MIILWNSISIFQNCECCLFWGEDVLPNPAQLSLYHTSLCSCSLVFSLDCIIATCLLKHIGFIVRIPSYYLISVVIEVTFKCSVLFFPQSVPAIAFISQRKASFYCIHGWRNYTSRTCVAGISQQPCYPLDHLTFLQKGSLFLFTLCPTRHRSLCSFIFCVWTRKQIIYLMHFSDPELWTKGTSSSPTSWCRPWAPSGVCRASLLPAFSQGPSGETGFRLIGLSSCKISEKKLW